MTGSLDLDLRSAADQLGVHYQTAYRWVRTGRLPATLVGGRYAIDPAAVDRLDQDRSEPSPPRHRRPRGGYATIASRAFDQLVDGDERAVRRLVTDLIATGVPLTTVMEHILSPALRTIGERWSDGELSISTEHRASAIVDRVLGEHAPRPRGRRRGTAMIAAPAGDHHSLPTSMAAAALREDNWHVQHLGADVPGDEIIAFCRDHDVDLAVLTVTAPDARVEAEQTAASLRHDGMDVLVGGAGDSLSDLRSAARSARDR